MIATASIDKHIDHIWWWIHQSLGADRIVAMYGSYFDESAVDGGGPVSAIGGLMLDHGQHYDLSVEWNRALISCRFPKDFIHMKDFGNHGELADYDVDEKRKLLSKLAWIINDNKNISIGSTLNPEDYRSYLPKVFGNKPEITIHGICFLLAATAQAKWANGQNYEYDIPFMLDEGCPDRKDIDRAHAFFRMDFPSLRPDVVTHAGTLSWGDDKKTPALQAADIIAWAVRRESAKQLFDNGTEPLIDVIAPKRHLKAHLEMEWFD
jgi:hypothetical protein